MTPASGTAKHPAAVELGRKGGRAKWAKVTKREKARIMAAVRATRQPKEGK